jgi:hypothetical protein|tara:strand:+ start:328 stop:615 length:288 start_codon:yes stop_codon:yes gene_type:complete
MTKKGQTEERIEQIIRQITGKVEEDCMPVPEVGIKGNGDIWCYHPTKRIFIKVTRGTRAYIVDDKENEYNRVLIYTFSGAIVEIEPEELIETGFD